MDISNPSTEMSFALLPTKHSKLMQSRKLESLPNIAKSNPTTSIASKAPPTSQAIQLDKICSMPNIVNSNPTTAKALKALPTSQAIQLDKKVFRKTLSRILRACEKSFKKFRLRSIRLPLPFYYQCQWV